jgi:hypothetical protein
MWVLLVRKGPIPQAHQSDSKGSGLPLFCSGIRNLYKSLGTTAFPPYFIFPSAEQHFPQSISCIEQSTVPRDVRVIVIMLIKGASVTVFATLQERGKSLCRRSNAEGWYFKSVRCFHLFLPLFLFCIYYIILLAICQEFFTLYQIIFAVNYDVDSE